MKFKSLLIGSAIGDAISLPFEFESRITLEQDPITEMTGNGTYPVPAGTFSDETSLAWILTETISEGYNINLLLDKMVAWSNGIGYTANGVIFDIGDATIKCIEKYKKSKKAMCGSINESENNNEALCRIFPLITILKGKKIDERFDLVKEVSCISHCHNRSILSCFFLCEFLLELAASKDKTKAYIVAQNKLKHIIKVKNVSKTEVNKFEKIYPNNIWIFGEKEIETSSYVVHTLEAALWCFFTTKTYQDAVLRAANLGDDNNAACSLTGAIAGLFYGYNKIPSDWLSQLAKKEELESLCDKIDSIFLL